MRSHPVSFLLLLAALAPLGGASGPQTPAAGAGQDPRTASTPCTQAGFAREHLVRLLEAGARAWAPGDPARLAQVADDLGRGRVIEALGAAALGRDRLAAEALLALDRLTLDLDAVPNPEVLRDREQRAERLESRARELAGEALRATALVEELLARARDLRQLVRGQRLPDFRTQDPFGNELHLRDLRGRLVLITFWDPAADLPEAALRRRVDLVRSAWDLPLAFVEVAPVRDREALLGLLERAGVHWDVAWEPDPERGASAAWQMRGARRVLLDRGGRVVGVDLGDTEVLQRVREVLAAEGLAPARAPDEAPKGGTAGATAISERGRGGTTRTGGGR